MQSTWDPVRKEHKCCGSKHTYHYSSCPQRSKIPGRASDPDFMKVQRCREDGLTSGQCASRENMPLGQVNDLWIL